MVFQLSRLPPGLILTRPSLYFQTCWYERWIMIGSVATLFDNCPSTVWWEDMTVLVCWGSGATTEPEPQKAGLWLGGRWWRLAGRREYWSERAGCSTSDTVSSGTESDIRPVSQSPNTRESHGQNRIRTPARPPALPAPPWQGVQVQHTVRVTVQVCSAHLMSQSVSANIGTNTMANTNTTLNQITLCSCFNLNHHKQNMIIVNDCDSFMGYK